MASSELPEKTVADGNGVVDSQGAATDPVAVAAPEESQSKSAAPIQTREKHTRVEVIKHPVDAGSSGEEDDEEEGGDEIEDSQILEDLPDETEDIELIHSRLNSNSVNKLGLPRFGGHLKRLCLRQNFISHVDPDIFGALTELEELDFYDNKIKHVGSALNNMSHLTSLDLSFNLLKRVPEELQLNLKSLKTIFFVQNKISHISHLEHFAPTLRSLELGGNRIRTIEGLDALVNLEELWLGKNKITKLEGLDGLKKLKILSIQSNRITRLEDLENLENLEELYISHNGITKLEGLEKNPKLRTLDAGNNFIEVLENISHLTHLEELWINDNKITSLQNLEPQLKHITTLETIYLEGNPVQKAEGANYRRKVTLVLPQIRQLDATYVYLPHSRVVNSFS
ncbi:L domain-like protein [Trametes gibbosa]|nr:L domain-like protein [Trametes gibbosa]